VTTDKKDDQGKTDDQSECRTDFILDSRINFESKERLQNGRYYSEV
jgi:hypothetical protein